MRKTTSFLLLFTCISFLTAPNAFSATPKIGGTCTKINQFHELKSTLLVCATIKGKKTWRKATSVEKSLYLKEKNRLAKVAAQKIIDDTNAAVAAKAAADKAAADAIAKAAADKAAADAIAKAAADKASVSYAV